MNIYCDRSSMKAFMMLVPLLGICQMLGFAIPLNRIIVSYLYVIINGFLVSIDMGQQLLGSMKTLFQSLFLILALTPPKSLLTITLDLSFALYITLFLTRALSLPFPPLP